MDVYVDDWHSRLNVLSNAVADIAMSADAVQGASDVSPAPAPEAETGSGSHGSDEKCFQFDADPEFPGADPELKSLY